VQPHQNRSRAADLYKDSKNLTKRLTKAVAVLLFIMLALVGTIVGLTAHVIEQAKDSKPGANGVMMSTGASPAPVSTGRAKEEHTLFSLLDASVQTIANIIDLKFVTDQNSVLLYTITGSQVRADGAGITFYAARGDVIELTPSAVTVTFAANEILINKTRQAFENANGRKLLWGGLEARRHPSASIITGFSTLHAPPHPRAPPHVATSYNNQDD
jgi:hypothetical protein